jgi:hypothetical protein
VWATSVWKSGRDGLPPGAPASSLASPPHQEAYHCSLADTRVVCTKRLRYVRPAKRLSSTIRIRRRVRAAPPQSRTKSPARLHRTPNMGVNLWGASPLDENGNLKEGSIPSVTPIDKVLGEGNCGEATNRGKEACEPSTGVAAGSVHAKAARLRTETPCRPRETLRRVADGQRSRSRQTPTVDGELVQRKFTLLFGEICARTRE